MYMKQAPITYYQLPITRRGFTLIEVLVVVGITIVMAGTLLAYNHESEKQFALSVSQAKLVGLLSRAKAHALEKYAGSNVDPDACGFGAHFDSAAPTIIILFQDKPFGSGERCFSDAGVENFSGTYDEGEMVETLTLDRGVTVVPPPANLTFVAPYLKVYADGMALTAPVTLTIRLGTEAPLIVTVGPGGDISGR